MEYDSADVLYRRTAGRIVTTLPKNPIGNGGKALRYMSDYDIIQAELANRELARRRYRSYLPYVHGGAWVRTRLSEFLADRVQGFR